MKNFRNELFWTLDAFQGKKIKKHFQEIQFIIENPSSKRANDIQSRNLSKILEHASTTTPYYKNLRNINSIESFPVIKKTIIQNSYDDFRSEEYIGKEYKTVSTSGSTGVPFFLYQDKTKKNRNTADVLFFSNLAGYTLGNKLYELEVWREHNKKRIYKSKIQNVHQFDITRLNGERIELFLKELASSNEQKNLLGFASAYEQICQYLDKKEVNDFNFNIKSIIANSEYLNAYTKKSMKQYFNAPVLSRYSSEEIGIIAHQTIDSPNRFLINNASYYVEILDINKDTPVKPGEFGRIVVTDLFNYCMPIIRYDTGDIAQLVDNKDGAHMFEHIEGRKMDLIYDTSGNIISSFVIYTKFYDYYKLLKQYQFIQEGKKEYKVKLNVHNKFPFETELIEDFKKDFGNDASIIIEYVDEIPPLSSGKRKKVVNNYHLNLSENK